MMSGLGFLRVFIGFGCVLYTSGSRAETAVILAPSLSWQVFSPRPAAEEETPTFYGYGQAVHAGLSHSDIEAKVGVEYVRSQIGAAELFVGDVVFLNYGLNLGYRYRSESFIGLRYDIVDYETRAHHTQNLMVGKWKGCRLGLVMSGSWRVRRDQYIDLGGCVASGSIEAQDQEDAEPKYIDSFGLHVTYLFYFD